MRKLLNNPKIVLPSSILVLIILLFRFGLFDDYKFNLESVFGQVSYDPIEDLEFNKVSELEIKVAVASMAKERWLPTKWQQYSRMKRELFVADYEVDQYELLKVQIDPTVVTPEEELIIIDFEKLESYIAEQLGLDEIGFFVRFENVLNLPVRKRPGDLLHSTDGRVLELGNIAIAETNRSDEEHAIAVQKKLAELQLSGSINTNIDKKIIDKDSKKNTGRKESAIIDGGIRPSGIYAQGELITKDPVIGLDEAHDSYVILVDSRGSTYELKLDE